MKISNLKLSEKQRKFSKYVSLQNEKCLKFFKAGEVPRSVRLPSLAECGPQWRRQDGRGTSHRVTLCLFVRDAG